MIEVKNPEVFEPHTLEFWEDVILGPVVFKNAFEPIGGEDDVLGTGDEKEKLPPPEDEEIDAMYDSMVGSESKEYHNAH